MKTYITFGQIHVHSVNGQTLDKDCVAVINADTPEAGRAAAMEWFDKKFFTSYTDIAEVKLEYYPRGLIEVNPLF